MARKGRVREVYRVGDCTITLAYASRFDATDIDRLRPGVRAYATLVEQIRYRVEKEHRTALGGAVPTGHVRTGRMWDSLMVSALGGARGERLRAAFSGRRPKSHWYNRDVAYTVSVADGIEILHPTAEEFGALLGGVSLAMRDKLGDTYGKGSTATDAMDSRLAQRIRSAMNGG